MVAWKFLDEFANELGEVVRAKWCVGSIAWCGFHNQVDQSVGLIPLEAAGPKDF